MKHKNKKIKHEKLAYAYYEQLAKNGKLEGTIDMYKEFLTKIKMATAEVEDAIKIVDRA